MPFSLVHAITPQHAGGSSILLQKFDWTLKPNTISVRIVSNRYTEKGIEKMTETFIERLSSRFPEYHFVPESEHHGRYQIWYTFMVIDAFKKGYIQGFCDLYLVDLFEMRSIEYFSPILTHKDKAFDYSYQFFMYMDHLSAQLEEGLNLVKMAIGKD